MHEYYTPEHLDNVIMDPLAKGIIASMRAENASLKNRIANLEATVTNQDAELEMLHADIHALMEAQNKNTLPCETRSPNTGY